MTWKPALPRYSPIMPARRASSSIRRTRAFTNVLSAAMPGRPGAAAAEQNDPVRDLAALLRAQHIRSVRQRLHDALARRIGEHDLLGAQLLEGSTVDGRRRQQCERALTGSLRLLAHL